MTTQVIEAVRMEGQPPVGYARVPAAAELTDRQPGKLNQNFLVSIGNSDGALFPEDWSTFIRYVQDLLEDYGVLFHGQWFSDPRQPWVNANWCFELPEAPSLHAYMSHAANLESELARIAALFGQDSIALTVGPVRFISPAAGVEPIVPIRERRAPASTR